MPKQITKRDRRLRRELRAIRERIEALERELDGKTEDVIREKCKPRPEDVAKAARKLRSQGVEI